MTRKRFTKLMMSFGLPRNEADALAGRIERETSYSEYFDMICGYCVALICENRSAPVGDAEWVGRCAVYALKLKYELMLAEWSRENRSAYVTLEAGA